ncbi:SAM-dependent methyltransferase [Streptomyces sp. NPDC004609]|uniref:SAM-dependent methyltransferase n=1 Tax=Streptomyces sp. NPDC004609 TaxID=3364704 RepID=UPI0036AD378D
MAEPLRLVRAVEELTLRADDRVLEIGCGTGVAVSLVAGRLTTGRITAIDRSAHAIAAARRRNADHLASGRAVLLHTPLSGLREPPAHENAFDTIFAVNVNGFWTKGPAAAGRDLDLVRGLLAPRGTFLLFYEPPGHARAAELEAVLRPRLTWPGARPEVVSERSGPRVLLSLRVTPD